MEETTYSIEPTQSKETTKQESSELVKQEEIEGTPFKLVTTEKGAFIAMGQYRLTEVQAEEELRKYVATMAEMNWEFITAVIGAITKQTILTFKGEI